MKVGVFDSGIGGLTVVKSLLEHKLFDETLEKPHLKFP